MWWRVLSRTDATQRTERTTMNSDTRRIQQETQRERTTEGKQGYRDGYVAGIRFALSQFDQNRDAASTHDRIVLHAEAFEALWNGVNHV